MAITLFWHSLLQRYLDNKEILASGRMLKGGERDGGCIYQSRGKKVRRAKGKTIQLVRALIDRGAKAPAPETGEKDRKNGVPL